MNSKTRMMVWAAMFAALAVVAAMVARFGPELLVPFSLLPFVSLLAGAVLGPRWGMMALLVYVLLGLVGVPVFAKAPYGGPTYFLQPTFGFIIGFVIAPIFVGWFIKKPDTGLGMYIVAALIGVAVIYIVGLPYLYGMVNFVIGKDMGFDTVLNVAFKPFIWFDIIKALVAAFLAKVIRERVLLAR